MDIKKIPVFVYETLKKHGIQREALGHEKRGEPAVLKGWTEKHKATWPTLKKGDGEVRGEILHVTMREIRELDDWESTYHRKIVHTDRGAAWAYLHNGDGE